MASWLACASGGPLLPQCCACNQEVAPALLTAVHQLGICGHNPETQQCCACDREVTSALLTAVHNLLERLTPSRPLPALAACVLLELPLLDDPEHSGCAVASL